MNLRIALRYRVALGYGLMGLALSVGFAAGTTFIADKYEEIFVAALLEGQAQTYLDELAVNRDTALPRSSVFSVYRQAQAPPPLRMLAPGIRELDLPGHQGVHVGVFKAHGQRLVLVLDVGTIETLEQYLNQLMVAVILGGTVLSAWLGWLFAARTIRPVSRLAQAVEALPLRPVATALASDYGEDGIGRLAAAIDRYQRRLVDADGKERQFFADASHELRTPITVIQGAVEVLRDDPETSARQDGKLARIDRSITELAYLLDALLLSARGFPEGTETLDLGDMCRRTVEQMAAADPSVRQRLRIGALGPQAVQAASRWVACILHVLFHRALAAAPQAIWQLRLVDQELTIYQPRELQPGVEPGSHSDLGLGIVFVERLCQELGWQLQQQLTPEQGLSISLRVPARDRAASDP